MITILASIGLYIYVNYNVNTENADYKFNTYGFALFHAVSSSILCILNLSLRDTITYNVPNTLFDNIVIANSVGYFFTDLIKCIYLYDYLFVAHHAVSLIFILLSYFYNMGSYLAITGLFVGEITNPILHIGWFLKYYKDKRYMTVWKINTVCFGIIRLYVAPCVVYNLWDKQPDIFFYKFINTMCFGLFYIASFFWFGKQVLSYRK